MEDELESTIDEAAQTIESVPETTIHVAQAGGEKSVDAMKGLADSINAALGELTSVQRELLDHLKAAKETAPDVIEEPLEGSQVTATDIAPEVTQPQSRFIRRNGRKIKRNA